jgi:putative heme degradation protein
VGIEASMGMTESAVNYAMVESLVSTLKSELLSNLEFMEKIGKVRVSNRYVPHEEKQVATLQKPLKHKLRRP